MGNCDYCGKDTELAFKCKYCGDSFCSEHRLPENHECPGLEEENQKMRDQGKIMSPTPSEKKRNDKKTKKTSINKNISKITNNLTEKLFKRGVAYTIIGICIVSFILQAIIPGFENFMIIHPGTAETIAPGALQSTEPLGLIQILKNVIINRPWSLVTSIFIHGSPGHLFINMLLLFFFGPELEKRVGKTNFLKIFFLAGIAGSLGHILFSYTYGILSLPVYIPALGASGALLGILTALTFIAPNIRVLVFFLIPAKLKHVLILYLMYNVVGMVTELTGTGIGGTAYAAHLAGAIIGIYYGKKLESYSRFNIDLF